MAFTAHLSLITLALARFSSRHYVSHVANILSCFGNVVFIKFLFLILIHGNVVKFVRRGNCVRGGAPHNAWRFSAHQISIAKSRSVRGCSRTVHVVHHVSSRASVTNIDVGLTTATSDVLSLRDWGGGAVMRWL